MKIFKPITAAIALAAVLCAGNVSANTIDARGSKGGDVMCNGADAAACFGFNESPTVLSLTDAWNYQKPGNPTAELNLLNDLLDKLGKPNVSFVNKTDKEGNSFMTGLQYFSIKKGQSIFYFENTSGGELTVDWSNEKYSHWTEYGQTAVPIPAAAWLFGSALVGLFGVSRRKSTSALQA